MTALKRRTAWAAICVCITLGATAARAGEEGAPTAMQSDAQLADVTFPDARHGWAVGDRGVIWQTSDGGAHWQVQPSGVTCRLASVFFLDDKLGWAAGGFTQPYTHGSAGVILRTRDGGQHWTVDRKGMLPAIKRLTFFDPAHGWALCEPSSYFPSGVLATSDGGRNWAALPAAESRHWLAADFIDPDTGALAGRASAQAAVRRRAIEMLTPDYGLRALRDMKLVAPAGGWLVGDGGLVLQTRDLGKSWQTPASDLPASTRLHFDFAALAVRGEHCWIAGTPGTSVLTTHDGGKTWALRPTGQPLPIHALTFIDERNGWAVGELGTILSTSDGGQTWRKQRAGGSRGAYLGFYCRGEDVPLELMARLSADEGYLGAIEILNRQDVEPGGGFAGDPAERAHEAVVLAGASAAAGAWRFPLRSAGLKLSAEQLIESWNRANDGGAIEKLESHLVARIRMWRPNVVFTVSADSRGRDPLAHVVNQLVLRAVERAADPAAYPAQISEAGLQPWKVAKLYGTLGEGQSGNASIHAAQLATRLGRSIGELASSARAVLGSDPNAAPAGIGFRLLVDHVPQGAGQRDFFSGIALAPGGDARRAFEDLGENNLEAMRREGQLRRNLQAIMARADGNDARDSRFLADIGQQTRGMEPGRAADVMYQLADRYARGGRWEMAAECFAATAERHREGPLAAASLVWLVQYYSSGETAWRNRAGQQLAVTRASAQEPAAGPPTGGVVKAAGESAAEQKPKAISAPGQLEEGGGLVGQLRGADEPRSRAAVFAKQLEQLDPALFGEPQVRFPLAAANRQHGLPRQAERFYLALRHSRPHDAWWAAAQTELWLAERKGQPPKELWNCPRATSKPRLDGKLDEPMWRAGNVVELRSPLRDDDDWRTVAMLAHDDEFFYLAASCNRAPAFKYQPNDQPRPHDADLADQDRIELLIDIDRDFATYYRLAVDHRGWTAESCWGDKTWNPGWFVAHATSDTTWTVEAAIPISELTAQSPAANQSWAVGIQRIVPGTGLQSWTQPATPEIVPEGFGLLMFQ